MHVFATAAQARGFVGLHVPARDTLSIAHGKFVPFPNCREPRLCMMSQQPLTAAVTVYTFIMTIKISFTSMPSYPDVTLYQKNEKVLKKKKQSDETLARSNA